MRVETVLISFLALAGLASAEPVYYDNTAGDDGVDVPYSANNVSGVGDSVVLSSPATGATDAWIMFANNGSNTLTFDATLSFYQAGSPVGAQIGNSFTVNNVIITPFVNGDLTTGEQLVDFSLGGIDLPQDLVFVAGFSNASSAQDVAIELASNPPAVGSNDADTVILQNGSGFSHGSLSSGSGNPIFLLSSETSTPEPSTWMLAGLSFAGLGFWQRRRVVAGK